MATSISDYYGGGEGSPSFGEIKPYRSGKNGSPAGAGLYGLPKAFSGWSGAARYAFAPAMDYAEQMKPVQDYYKGEMGKDYQADLYGRSSDIYEAQNKDASRRRQQGLARAGYGGGGAVSPFAALQVQQEAAARAGALGSAAREAVFQAQAMKTEAARNYGNSLSSVFQALLTPAQIQASRRSRVPLGNTGPGLIGPAMNAGAALIGAAT